MIGWYDILDIARNYGYRIEMYTDATIKFIPAHGARPEHAITYPVQGLALRGEEVIEELKKWRKQ